MKSSPLFLASGFWLLASPFSPALEDRNANGMIDVWERLWNSGDLFTWDFLPWEDDDGDGTSNGEESVYGTDPLDPASRPLLISGQTVATYGEPDENGQPVLLTPATFDVSFPTITGKRYLLQSSTLLVAGSWSDVGDPIIGDGNVSVTHFPLPGPDKMFFRVKVSDAPGSEGEDGPTLYEESLLASDPSLAGEDDTGNGGSGGGGNNGGSGGGTNPNPDRDNDGVPDSEDADPLDKAISWPRSSGFRYIFVGIPEKPTTHTPYKLGNNGAVLAHGDGDYYPTGGMYYNPMEDKWYDSPFPFFPTTPSRLWVPGDAEWTSLPQTSPPLQQTHFVGNVTNVADNGDAVGRAKIGAQNDMCYEGAVRWKWNASTRTYGEAERLWEDGPAYTDWRHDYFWHTRYPGAPSDCNGRGDVLGPPQDVGAGENPPPRPPVLYSAGGGFVELNLHREPGEFHDDDNYHLSSGGDVLWAGYAGNEEKNRVRFEDGEEEDVPDPMVDSSLAGITRIPGKAADGSRDVVAIYGWDGMRTRNMSDAPGDWKSPVVPIYPDKITDHGMMWRTWPDSSFWLNGEWFSPEDLLPANHGLSDLEIIDVNRKSMVLAKATQGGAEKHFLLAPATILCDFNRDGKITSAENAAITTETPWRWWINDDADVGDICDDQSDIPGIQHTRKEAGENSNGELVVISVPVPFDSTDNVVNHRGDIVDFFPVQLDLKTVLNLFPAGGVTVKLKHAGNALNFVYTDLEPSKAGNFLKYEGTEGEGNTAVNHDVYGPAFDQPVRNAPTVNITAAGVELSADFLSKIREGGKEVTGENNVTTTNPEKGVILLEGKEITDAPLIMEILQGTEVIGEIKLPLKLSSVKDMHRWINLRGICKKKNEQAGGLETDATNIAQPSNYPDELTNGKTLVFIHGFSNSERQARGWNAEIFKRFHQSGSRAKFVGVTWRGDYHAPLDYRINVVHAFETSPSFMVHVKNLPGEKYLMAHSLGNMVASSAIKDWKLNVAKYFAINVAVAMEAYDESLKDNEEMRNSMCDPSWQEYEDASRPENPRRLWSTEWHKLYEDERNTLTWRGRFGNIPNMWNLYSSGENVLENDEPGARSFPVLWEDGWFSSSGRLAWAAQEKSKGTLVTPGTSHGGWGFYVGLNAWASDPSLLFTYPDVDFQSRPVFKPFDITGIHSYQYRNGTRVNFPVGYLMRSKLLGEALPALSWAAGANALNPYGEERNIDMMKYRLKKNENLSTEAGGDAPANIIWPKSGDEENPKPWEHSDFRNVAFYYTCKFYEEIVNKGEFKQ